MTEIGQHKNKIIVHIKYDPGIAWYKDLPEKNWLLFFITDKKEIRIFDEITRRASEKNVVYVCAAGKEAESFHDWVDELMCIRETENEYLPAFTITTTWHRDLGEGFWFALHNANSESKPIDTIVCLNFAEGEKNETLAGLTIKINSGWIHEVN